MNKRQAFLISLVMCTSFSYASDYWNDDKCCCEEDYGCALVLKQGVFVPQEKVLRDIFDCRGTPCSYFIEGAFRYNFFRGLNLELSGSYIQHKGCALVYPCTTCGNESACCNQWCCSGNGCRCGAGVRFKMPTVGLGLKYFYKVSRYVEFFLGGAIKALLVRIENCSCYVPRCDKENKPGGSVSVGILFNSYKGLFFELCADYLFGKIKGCSSSDCNMNCCSMNCDLNVSGLSAGVSLGIKY